MPSAYILPFNEIYPLIPRSETAEKITIALSNCALLVRGVWILHSKYQYAEGTRAFNARQYLLSLFSEQEYVSRSDFNQIARLSPEMCKNMLGEIARLCPGSGWKLKWSTDHAYCRRFPQVVELHQKELAKIGQTSLNCLKLKVDRASRVRGVHASSGGAASSGRTLGGGEAAASSSIVSLMDMNLKGATISQQLLDLIKDLVRLHSCISYEFCKRAVSLRCRSEVEGNLLYGEDIDKQTLETHLNQVCVHMHDLYLAKLAGDPAIDKVFPHLSNTHTHNFPVSSICPQSLQGKEWPEEERDSQGLQGWERRGLPKQHVPQDHQGNCNEQRTSLDIKKIAR